MSGQLTETTGHSPAAGSLKTKFCASEEVSSGSGDQEDDPSCVHQVTELVTEAVLALNERRCDLLEVCCPWDSPLSKAVEEAGGRAIRIGVHDGIDLSTKSGYTKALKILQQEKPRYLHVSPPCDPRTSINNANQRTEEMRANLEAKRTHGRRILKHCLKLIQVQRQEHRHAGGEQPLCATSWKEPSVRKMVQLCCPEKFRCDGCRFEMWSERCNLPIKKPWGWFSSMEAIKEALNLKCRHKNQRHAKLRAFETAATATYPEALCKAFARALMENRKWEIQDQVAIHAASSSSSRVRVPEENSESRDDPEAPVEELVPEEPERSQQEENPEEQEAGPGWQTQKILKQLKVIHANLGHPSNQVLCKMLREAGAGAEVLEQARQFACPHCAQRGHAQPHKTSQIQQATKKWEVISVDTFWWHSPHRDEKGNPVEHIIGVSFLDEASDYHVASIIRSGCKTQRVISAQEFREVFSRDWLRLLPKPEGLRFDDEGAFRDLQTIEWLEGQAIKINVVAGEAAWQVGKHSRHLEVLKENMSLLSSDMGSDVKASELLGLCLAAKNELHNVAGYSPNQWVFGQERSRIRSFLQNGQHLPTQSLRERETFEENLQKMDAAGSSFLKADSSRRILRAARGRARRAEKFEVGQLVYFYRKNRTTGKADGGWHGPARVVTVEKQGDDDRNQTQGSIIWVTHGTVLYRCASEQLRAVPKAVSDIQHELLGNKTPQEQVREQGNNANYRDISQDMSEEPEDSVLHDDEPGSGRGFPAPVRRIFGKTALEHGRPEEGPAEEASAAGRPLQSGGPAGRAAGGEDSVPPPQREAPRPGNPGDRKVRRQDGERGPSRSSVRDLDRRAPVRKPEVREAGGVCLPHGVSQQGGGADRHGILATSQRGPTIRPSGKRWRIPRTRKPCRTRES